MSFDTLITLAPLSARALILNLIDTGEPPHISVQQLVRAGAAFDIEPTSIRSALTRLKMDGQVESTARGEYGIGANARALQRHILTWRTVLDQRRQWHGSWLMVVTGARERADRTVWRHTLRALSLSGFVEAEPNIWLRPANLHGGAAGMRKRLAALDAAADLLLVEAHAIDDARAARLPQLWTINALHQRYVALTTALESSTAGLTALPPARAAAETLMLGREAIATILHDPLLPENLCSSVPLVKLIATMDAYDRIGKRLWHRFLRIDSV